MTHATEGLLQAYLDEEIGGSAAADLRDHLASCPVCASELEALQRAGRHVHESLEMLGSADAPMLRARAGIAAQRRATAGPARRSMARLGAGGFAKAAMLLLALAGAGAAAIPGSPVRRALETTFARVAQLFNGAPPAEQVVAPAAEPVIPAEPVASRMGVLPADGRVRVLLHSPAADVEVIVRLVDEPLAQVETATSQEGVRFRTGPGRIEVSGLAAGVVTVDIPRTVQAASVEVDGLVHVYKEGRALQRSGAAGREQGDQVRFRIGT